MHIPHVCSTANQDLAQALELAINNKTKPVGSLGLLETVAKQIGLVLQTVQPELEQPSILVFASDHGITAEGVSAYPQDVTWQMVENFLGQGAAINVFARQHQMALHIVDAGVNHDFGQRAGLLDRKVGHGTHNFLRQAAMSLQDCELAMRHGMELVALCPGNVLGFGEMGIGNTTSAAAIMHVLTGQPISQCVGAGTGLSSAGVSHKAQVIQAAVAHHASRVNATDSLAVLATFGGFEIAMMAGAMLQAASQRRVLLIDGFIATSALLVAWRLQPAILDYCVFCHCSDESGHQLMLDELGAAPLLQLGLRLGEGTGCALAWPLLQAASGFLREMSTFASAQVSQSSTT
ncbi:MAG: nicotinate-nucleotide--dimethylbenzimidazole phosphoribosyltransferase [Burkholderiaceae bacterium]|nr:nicotinate-nucleotide--dimethylbenzimidazole phosphoribosyltransferase [Burkholderiaceae bacterium]